MRPAISIVVITKGIAIHGEFHIPFLYVRGPDQGVISTSLFPFKGP